MDLIRKIAPEKIAPRRITPQNFVPRKISPDENYTPGNFSKLIDIIIISFFSKIIL